MTDRAPVTAAGRDYLDTVSSAVLDPTIAKMLGATGEVLVALVSPDGLRDAILAIEAEAADAAVPQGLDVERLAEWFHNKWESQGIACWHGNQHIKSWDCGRDAIEAAEYAKQEPSE